MSVRKKGAKPNARILAQTHVTLTFLAPLNDIVSDLTKGQTLDTCYIVAIC